MNPWIVVIVVLLLLGLRWFLLQDLSEAEAVSLMRAGAVVVDVRTPGEFAAGHVEGALNLPLDELGDLVASRVPDTSSVILVYCLSGTRSMMAKQILRAAGYEQTYNLGTLSRAQKLSDKAGGCS